MAGPGSRLEKVGTIFSRVTGLLRSGAIKDVDKPVWYEVYAAFPPKHEPKYDRELPEMKITNITYLEDFIRAKFYNVYGNPDVVDMRNSLPPSLSQRFLEHYMELEKQGTEEKGRLFTATAEALKAQGFRLKTLEELQKEQEEKVRASLAEKAAREAHKTATIESPRRILERLYSEDLEDNETMDEDSVQYSDPEKPHR